MLNISHKEYINPKYYPSGENLHEKGVYVDHMMNKYHHYIPFNSFPSTIMSEDYCVEMVDGWFVLRYPDIWDILPMSPIYDGFKRSHLDSGLCTSPEYLTETFGVNGVDVWMEDNLEPLLHPTLEIMTRLWDYEFVYKVDAFRHMNGGQWETFRKNSRKWINRVENRDYIKWSMGKPGDSTKLLIEKFFAEWVDSKGYDDVMGVESLYDKVMYGFERPWTIYLTMFYKDDPLVVLVGEVYGGYTYFTVCITSPEESFLEEYARLQFMNNVETVLVNDGGCLDDEGLRRFKTKMNPVAVKEVLSYYWTKKV
jgi:hypothetical protein